VIGNYKHVTNPNKIENVKLIMMDGGSHSASINFRYEKKTIINELTNIIIGIS